MQVTLKYQASWMWDGGGGGGGLVLWLPERASPLGKNGEETIHLFYLAYIIILSLFQDNVNRCMW